MKRNVLCDYDFKYLCNDLKALLRINLHPTKQADDFMWIATEEYDIGAYPMHYEIRLEKNKVYAEVHYESKDIITYEEKNETHRELQEQFVAYFDNNKNFGVVKLRTSPKCYRWYRLKESGVDLADKNCAKRVLENVHRMVRLTQKDLLGLMGKVFE